MSAVWHSMRVWCGPLARIKSTFLDILLRLIVFTTNPILNMTVLGNQMWHAFRSLFFDKGKDIRCRVLRYTHLYTLTYKLIKTSFILSGIDGYDACKRISYIMRHSAHVINCRKKHYLDGRRHYLDDGDFAENGERTTVIPPTCILLFFSKFANPD